jgi:hypothetical protein
MLISSEKYKKMKKKVHEQYCNVMFFDKQALAQSCYTSYKLDKSIMYNLTVFPYAVRYDSF